MHIEVLDEFLTNYRLLFLTIHILSMAIGLGGATVSDILFFKFLKDNRVSKKEEEVLHILKDVILAAILCILISGLALYIPEMERLSASPLFLVKVIATTVVMVNGIALHMFIAPHLIHFNLRNEGQMGRGWQRLAFTLGSISVCSWYSAFLIAMLKEAIPWGFTPMLSLYLLLLASAIVGSQIMERMLSKRAKNVNA